MTDDFLCLGAPRAGQERNPYGPEPGGNRYYLWTSVPSEQALTAGYPRWGGLKPPRVGQSSARPTNRRALHAGSNPLLFRYDKPGAAIGAATHQTAACRCKRRRGVFPVRILDLVSAGTANAERWFRKTLHLGEVRLPKRGCASLATTAMPSSINGREVGRATSGPRCRNTRWRHLRSRASTRSLSAPATRGIRPD